MKYLTIRRYFPLLAVAIWLGGASCSRYFVPSGKAAYTELQVDTTVADDPDYVRFYAPYKKQLEAEMNRVVGHAAVSLTKPRDAPETLLGNFFADVLLAEARKQDPEADFSFGTKGGLRIELHQGPITIGHLFELMPFENEIVILELTGERVRELAQFIATTDGQPVSGIRMEIDGGKATDIRIGGKPLDNARTYKLATYDYLANGGDNSRGLNDPVSRTDLGMKVREALIDYVSSEALAGNDINVQLDGRITRNQ
ncbi:5'-nucleotidase C-terminal domain-containing protein [Parapedobacter sp. 2B3]|uniref:5'-nucleotidase C-terminal domain-containing protein n=1 Tax=Parapedobacter sp. 2B3 TaxID=3342381 RepID=UPI0035B5FBD2